MDGDTSLRLRVFGELAATRDGAVVDLGGRRQRAVLAALVVSRDQVVPPDRLADCVWGEAGPANATGAIQAYVSHLRRRLQPEVSARSRDGVIASTGAGYVLRLGPETVDAWCFERAVDTAASLAPADAARALDDALRLWRGPPYAEYAGESWVEAESVRLTELLTVGVAGIPGVEEHAESVLEALDPWTGGNRLPNFTFSPEEYVDAYDEPTITRLRRAIRTYDPLGVMAIGRVLFSS